MREDQIRRYARHVLLPDVGGAGQRRILAAVVAIDDAGAAGSAAIVYLAAAGVGTIVVGDARAVTAADVGALYESGDVGKPRVEAARARVAALNPDVRVIPPSVHPERRPGEAGPESKGALRIEIAPTVDPLDAFAEGAAAASRVLRAIVEDPR